MKNIIFRIVIICIIVIIFADNCVADSNIGMIKSSIVQEKKITSQFNDIGNTIKAFKKYAIFYKILNGELDNSFFLNSHDINIIDHGKIRQKYYQNSEKKLGKQPDYNNGTTWYVDDILGEGPNNPSEDFTIIQDAITQANNGDTIYVYNGFYKENLYIFKSLIIQGENRTNTIIDGGNIESVIKITNDWIKISNFTLKNGFHGIFLFRSNYNKITKNKIINNTNCGIKCGFSMNNKINSNDIRMNSQFGIDIRDISDNNLIVNNVITNNGQTGISISNVINNTIDLNDISNNKGIGIKLKDTSSNIIYKNNITLNLNTGIDTVDSFDNKIFYNNIQDNNNIGICVFGPQSSNNIVENNTIYGNKNGIILTYFSKNNNINKNKCINNNVDGIGVFEKSSQNTINENICIDNMKGISIRKSNNLIIKKNVCDNNQQGLLLNNVNNSNVDSNKCNRNGVGIYLFNSKDNQINHNTFSYNNHKGLTIRNYSNNNVIENNYIGPWNYQGIYIEKSHFNIIQKNYLVENNDDGIGLILTMGNKINNNNIIDNTNNGIEGTLCFDDASNNYWGHPPSRWISDEESHDIYTPFGYVKINPHLEKPIIYNQIFINL